MPLVSTFGSLSARALGLGGYRASGAFSPSSLFASGEQGVWYDPSDLTTMWEDWLGATPVHTPGNGTADSPVGLIWDKSVPMVYSAHRYWRYKIGSAIDTAHPRVSRIVLSTSTASTNIVVFTTDNCSDIGTIPSTNATYSYDFGSATTIISASIYAVYTGGTRSSRVQVEWSDDNSNWSKLFDGIAYSNNCGLFSVTNCGPRNGAFRSTSTQRPTLSARYNLLTYSEQFDNAAWTKTNMTATDGATDPNGGSTAETLVATAANGTVTQSFTAVATDYTFSVYLKRKTGTGNIDISCNSGGTWVTKTITSSWAQYSVTQTLTAGSKTPGIRIVTSGDEVYAWGADLRVSNDGVGLPAYQRIADANTYDSTGFPYYIKSDGVDDGLTTLNTVDFSGTNKVTLFSAQRMLASANFATVFQLNNNDAASSFCLFTPGLSANTYRFTSGGTTTVVNQISTYTAPINGIITGIGDISAPNNQIRVNGSVGGTQTGSQGSGNYSNAFSYLLSRNSGTAFFNGRIYGLIIRGASSTSTEIGNTETWLNNITKAY